MQSRAPQVQRLIDRLIERLDEIADRMVRVYRDQIPEYRALPPDALADVRRISRQNMIELFRAVRERRLPTDAELSEFAASARRRLLAGVSLESLLQAYRLGNTVAWEAIVEASSGGNARDLAAALEISGALARYLEQVSTIVTKSYMVEREHLLTAEEHHHRRVAEALLAEGSSSSDVDVLAAAAGIELAPAYWIVLLTAREPARALRDIALRLRAWNTPLPVIAAPWQDDAVLALWPADGATEPSGLVDAQRVLGPDHPELRMAFAGPTASALEEALDEARAVLAVTSPGRITRLEDVPLPALVRQSTGRIADVLRARLRPLEEQDTRHETELRRTLIAYLACDGAIQGTAGHLHVHRNTVVYRLGRIRELTGLDPDRLDDLFLLRAGLLLEGIDRA